MKTIQKGNTGGDVKTLQRLLNERMVGEAIKVDGKFGPGTQMALEAFQRRAGLYDDGIAGPETWAALSVPRDSEQVFFEPIKRLRIIKLPADAYGDGYNSHRLRSDVADHYARAYREIEAAGAILTSSGSMRSLSAEVGSNRSATSLHYLGRAFDLFVHSGMSKPMFDPYVIVRDGERRWRIFARAKNGKTQALVAWNHKTFSEELVTGTFIDLTAILEAHGFKPIQARRSYSKNNYGASEWWHFQFEAGLIPGLTRFGDELLKLYPLSQLEGTVPFQSKDAIWHEDWF